ncbi:MAG: hypothetical protein DYG83_08570 [Candidatus Brocadia sp. AMX2]|nr:hypothetical protein [Candidatus Brocadia sp.]MCE7866866.1 hypothetical protein [Candidatus Brocadia sp. AMX2]MCQ3918594.1 hypothetical protein [Candidatus Brocadia sp.]RIJ91269.1 MAG: hypothetical protein DB853_08225 [Candidatus Brocadia sp.]
MRYHDGEEFQLPPIIPAVNRREQGIGVKLSDLRCMDKPCSSVPACDSPGYENCWRCCNPLSPASGGHEGFNANRKLTVIIDSLT